MAKSKRLEKYSATIEQRIMQSLERTRQGINSSQQASMDEKILTPEAALDAVLMSDEVTRQSLIDPDQEDIESGRNLNQVLGKLNSENSQVYKKDLVKQSNRRREAKLRADIAERVSSLDHLEDQARQHEHAKLRQDLAEFEELQRTDGTRPIKETVTELPMISPHESTKVAGQVRETAQQGMMNLVRHMEGQPAQSEFMQQFNDVPPERTEVRFVPAREAFPGDLLKGKSDEEVIDMLKKGIPKQGMLSMSIPPLTDSDIMVDPRSGELLIPEPQLLPARHMPAGEDMAEHPFLFTLAVEGITALFMKGGLGKVISAPLRRAAFKTASKTVTKASVKAAAAKSARMMATYGSLGLGATWIAEQMRDDPESSDTAALVIEVLGPAATVVLFGLGLSGGTIALARMAAKNEAKYAALNTKLAGRTDAVAKRLKDAMSKASEKQFEVSQMSSEEVFNLMMKDQPAAMSRLVKMAGDDPGVIKSQTELVKRALNGPSSREAELIGKAMGTPNMGHLVGAGKLPTELSKLPALTDIDDMVQFLQKTPARQETGALLRHTYEQLKNARIIGESNGQLSKQQLRNISDVEKMYKKAVVGMDKKLIDEDFSGLLQTEYGQQLLGNLDSMQRNVGHSLLYETLTANKAWPTATVRGKTHQFINSHIRPLQDEIFEHKFDLNPDIWKVEGSSGVMRKGLRSVKSLVQTPKAFFLDNANELVIKPQRQLYQKEALRAYLGRAWNGIEKGLTRSEKRQLNSLLMNGDDAGETFAKVRGGLKSQSGEIFSVSPKLRDRYYAARDFLDYTYELSNEALNRAFRNQNIKLMDDSTYVKIAELKGGQKLLSGKVFTEDMAESGMKAVRIMDSETGKVVDETILEATEVQSRIKDIPQGFRSLPYHEGWVPIRYKGNYDVISIHEGRDGKFIAQRVANAKTQREAQEAIANLLEQEGEESLTHFMAVRAKVSTGDVARRLRRGKAQVYKKAGTGTTTEEKWASFIKTNSTSDYLRGLEPEKLEGLARSLEEMGMDQTALAGFLDETKLFSLTHKGFQRGRANLRKADATDLARTAPRMDTSRSVSSYLDSLSSTVNFTEANIRLQEKFVKSFNHLLDVPEDWTSNIGVMKTASRDGLRAGHEALEAKMVQNQLKTIANMKGGADQLIDRTLEGLADSFYKRGSDEIGRLIDRAADSRGLSAAMKGMTAVSKFGFFAVDQLLVQSSGMLNAIGRHSLTDPAELVNVTRQASKYIASKVAGKPVDEEAKFIMHMLDDSGYLNAIQYQAIQDMGHFRVPIVSKAAKRSTVFFRWGETANRLTAYLNEMNLAIKQIRKGTHPKFKSMDDVPTADFRQYVAARADVTSFNMNKLNQPMFAKGWSGVPTQFWQFGVHQAELMFGSNAGPKGLRKREILGIWAAWMGALGLNGVPFSADIAVFGEEIIANRIQQGRITLKEGQPEIVGKLVHKYPVAFADLMAESAEKMGFEGDKKFWRRLVKKGGLSAMSDGQINLANRAGLSSFLNTFYDGFTADDMLGAGGQVWYDLIYGTSSSVVDIARTLRDPNENLQRDDFLRMMERTLNGFTAPRNALRGIRALESGEVRTATGNLMKEGMTLKEIMLLTMGLPDDDYTDIYEHSNINFRRREAWQDWQKTVYLGVSRAIRSGDIKGSMEMLNSAVAQIKEYRPDLLPYFMRNSYRFMRMQRDLSQEDRNRLQRMKDIDLYGNELEGPFDE